MLDIFVYVKDPVEARDIRDFGERFFKGVWEAEKNTVYISRKKAAARILADTSYMPWLSEHQKKAMEEVLGGPPVAAIYIVGYKAGGNDNTRDLVDQIVAAARAHLSACTLAELNDRVKELEELEPLDYRFYQEEERAGKRLDKMYKAAREAYEARNPPPPPPPPQRIRKKKH